MSWYNFSSKSKVEIKWSHINKIWNAQSASSYYHLWIFGGCCLHGENLIKQNRILGILKLTWNCRSVSASSCHSCGAHAPKSVNLGHMRNKCGPLELVWKETSHTLLLKRWEGNDSSLQQEYIHFKELFNGLSGIWVLFCFVLFFTIYIPKIWKHERKL